MSRTSAAGIRMTKVGLWFVLFSLLVGVAATNTGNNALYMVLAIMLGTLVLSGLTSRNNLRRLTVEAEPPDEVFANAPFELRFRLENRGRLLPRWFLMLAVDGSAAPLFVPFLPRGGSSGEGAFLGQVELLLRRRGTSRIGPAYLWSLFPLGFFRKGRLLRLDLEVLVFPELFPAASYALDEPGRMGEESHRRTGWGHDLHALRGFRPGDDPRSIHWKQTARTGAMIYKEREAEENRRLAIVVDNAVGELVDAAARARFERLVSEAATAAVDYLERGFEVELVTREGRVPFASGRRQRRTILERLALLETRPHSRAPLETTSDAAQLRLVLDSYREVEAATEGVA